jgi:hypothetical protein
MIPNLKLMALVSDALQLTTLAVALGLPIWRIAATGRFWPSFFRMWLYMILWAILVSMFIPPVVAALFHDKRVYDYFPDGLAVTGMIFGGWVSCMILCALTTAIRNVWIHFRS